MRLFYRPLIAFFMIFSDFNTIAVYEDIRLPPPQTQGGMGVLDALYLRSSASGFNFPKKGLSPQDLSTLLWAASGLNRNGKGWTTPMAMGMPPYCKIYVLNESGVFLYNWQKQSLAILSTKDARSEVAPQEYVKNSPCLFIFVADGVAFEKVTNDKALALHFSSVTTGAMTQNIYLAASSINVGVRYIHLIKHEAIRKILKLNDQDEALCLLMLGKR